MIIENINKLRKVSRYIEENENVEDTIKELFTELSKNSAGNCLSANQIGKFEQVGVVNVNFPIHFINPKIIEKDIPLQVVESSLSFPNQLFITKRYGAIVVKAQNFGKPVYFGIPRNASEFTVESKIVQESIYIQQMIDSMNGKFPIDNKWTPGQATSEKIYHRNELITIIKDKDEKKIKFKRLDFFMNQGWKIKE